MRLCKPNSKQNIWIVGLTWVKECTNSDWVMRTSLWSQLAFTNVYLMNSQWLKHVPQFKDWCTNSHLTEQCYMLIFYHSRYFSSWYYDATFPWQLYLGFMFVPRQKNFIHSCRNGPKRLRSQGTTWTKEKPWSMRMVSPREMELRSTRSNYTWTHYCLHTLNEPKYIWSFMLGHNEVVICFKNHFNCSIARKTFVSPGLIRWYMVFKFILTNNCLVGKEAGIEDKLEACMLVGHAFFSEPLSYNTCTI